MHMEHTFRVSGLVPGIFGSLPSPRAKVQAKLASAVTKQEKPRCQRTKLWLYRWAKEKNWYQFQSLWTLDWRGPEFIRPTRIKHERPSADKVVTLVMGQGEKLVPIARFPSVWALGGRRPEFIRPARTKAYEGLGSLGYGQVVIKVESPQNYGHIVINSSLRRITVRSYTTLVSAELRSDRTQL